ARRITSMIPNWSNIANSVKSIQPILRPTVLLQDHATDSQISRSTTGMRKNSNKRNFASRFGIWSLLASSSSRKQAVGLRNADNHTTTLNQNGRLRRDCGIEAFICLTARSLQPALSLHREPIGSHKQDAAQKNTEAHKKQSDRHQHETIALWLGKRWDNNDQSSQEAE